MIALYSGEIALSDMLEMNQRISKDPDFNSNFNIILDVRNMEHLLKFEEIKMLVDYYSKNTDNMSNIRLEAILSKKEDITAGSILFEKLSDKLPMRFKTVYSLKAALDWVGIRPEYEEMIKYELNELRN